MFRSPRQLPPLSILLRDIPATPTQVAKHLGISRRTLQRYSAAEQAPRAVMLALFWETRWGISVANTQTQNDAARYYSWAMALERENRQLRAKIERLQDMADFGSANRPLFRA
ncbi:MAG: hypothetical protein WCX93_07715 [Burkholderiaceae bacterium]